MKALLNKISYVILSLAVAAGGCSGCGTSAPGDADESQVMIRTVNSGSEDEPLETTEEAAAGEPEGIEASYTEQRLDTSALSASAADFYVRQKPGILVDAGGYTPGGEKTAVFVGERLPAVFEVRDDETDEVVFTGEIKLIPGRSEENGIKTGTGDFTEFDRTGRYYLRAQLIGESEAFDINGELYEELLDKELRRYYLNRCGVALTEEFAGESAHGVCHSAEASVAGDSGRTMNVTGGWHMNEKADRFTESGAQIVNSLLLAYELNPDAFGDDTGIPESGNEVPDVLDEVLIEINWLLRMQDSRSGGVYSAAVTSDDAAGTNLLTAPVEVRSMTADAAISFAAAMAKFGYVYKGFDGDMATTCLRAADRAFSWYQQAGGDMNSMAYDAAAELYRATGSDAYGDTLESFFEEEGFFERAADDLQLLYGSVTYLRTQQPVNFSASEKLMKTLSEKGEETADAANNTIYGAAVMSGTADSDSVAKLLLDMTILAVCDYVSYSYEYTMLIEKHLHALDGRNDGAKNYLYGFSGDSLAPDYPGVFNQPAENAGLSVSVAMLLKDGE